MQPPELIYEQEESREMRAKGDPASVQLTEVVERVRGVLNEERAKTSEVREWLGEPTPSLPQLRTALAQLAENGEVERDPAMREGDVRGRSLMWRRCVK